MPLRSLSICYRSVLTELLIFPRLLTRSAGSCVKSKPSVSNGHRPLIASAFRSLPSNQEDHDGAQKLQLGALPSQDQDLLPAPRAASSLEEQDVALVLDTLLALGSGEQVKRLVQAHPDLLLMGFELPGAAVRRAGPRGRG